MAKTLPVFRGIVGPWCHDWPDCNQPGKMSKANNCLMLVAKRLIILWSVVIPAVAVAVAVAVDNEETLGINIVLPRPYPITSNLLTSISSVKTK